MTPWLTCQAHIHQLEGSSTLCLSWPAICRWESPRRWDLNPLVDVAHDVVQGILRSLSSQIRKLGCGKIAKMGKVLDAAKNRSVGPPHNCDHYAKWTGSTVSVYSKELGYVTRDSADVLCTVAFPSRGTAWWRLHCNSKPVSKWSNPPEKPVLPLLELSFDLADKSSWGLRWHGHNKGKLPNSVHDSCNELPSGNSIRFPLSATLFKSKAARSIVLLRLSSDAGLFSVPLWESLDSLGLGTLDRLKWPKQPADRRCHPGAKSVQIYWAQRRPMWCAVLSAVRWCRAQLRYLQP